MVALNVDTPKEDDEARLLNVNESFRKAKRNCLFWGAATIAFSWAQISDASRGLEFSIFSRGLSFSQDLVVFFCFVVLAFMVIGYQRAEWHLMTRNSPFAYSLTMTKASAEAERLVETIKDASEKLKRAVSVTDQVNKWLIKHTEELGHQGARYVAALESDILETNRLVKRALFDANNRVNSLGQGSGDPAEAHADYLEIRSIANELDAALGTIIDESNSRTHGEEQFLALEKAATEGLRLEIPNVKATPETITMDWPELAELSSRLKGLSGVIDRRDRVMFFFYDRGLVWSISILGLISAGLRWFAPERIVHTLNYWGLGLS